ncbi:hypothetical protein [Pelotomaculum propionicicum]|uniref:hypothetical protein n=1 Tax=Pelotomaculum propionicicum TaxID=258475 RepID=UPI003BA2C34F
MEISCCANLEILAGIIHLSVLTAFLSRESLLPHPCNLAGCSYPGCILPKKKPAVVVAGYGKERVQGFLKGIYFNFFIFKMSFELK